eukprot:m.202014 g.202014  ORF g.202014 m.202014 type:complete len:213 (+) comp15748_c1_seq17:2-640(+)
MKQHQHSQSVSGPVPTVHHKAGQNILNSPQSPRSHTSSPRITRSTIGENRSPILSRNEGHGDGSSMVPTHTSSNGSGGDTGGAVGNMTDVLSSSPKPIGSGRRGQWPGQVEPNLIQTNLLDSASTPQPTFASAQHKVPDVVAPSPDPWTVPTATPTYWQPTAGHTPPLTGHQPIIEPTWAPLLPTGQDIWAPGPALSHTSNTWGAPKMDKKV